MKPFLAHHYLIVCNTTEDQHVVRQSDVFLGNLSSPKTAGAGMETFKFILPDWTIDQLADIHVMVCILTLPKYQNYPDANTRLPIIQFHRRICDLYKLSNVSNLLPNLMFLVVLWFRC